MQTKDNYIFTDIPTSEITFVKGSTFQMGTKKDNYKVTLSDYWIGTFPVTQAL